MSETIHRNRPMSRRELEAAINADRREFPQEMPCINCGYRWMQHLGKLCPAKPGGFIFNWKLGEAIPVMPVYQEKTTFLPDVAYYNQSPDFDVV